MEQLQGRVALVTGGGRGIGRATALSLAQVGAAVVVVARTTAEVRAVADEITAHGGRALSMTADVTQRRAITNVVAETEARLGPIDILINNAGVMPLGALADSDPAEWVFAIHVNLIGPYHCMRVVLPGMLSRGWGRIVNVSSVLATAIGSTQRSAYVTSKAALDRLTLAAAAEQANTGVTINGVYPGMTDTAMQAQLRNAPPDVVGAEQRAWYRERYARGDVSDPREPARLITAIVLSQLHGQIINLDDARGRHLRQPLET
jgi:NAD(P)-dependent dehydrogenase (short-subunit alcohol dehydrogenase family)